MNAETIAVVATGAAIGVTAWCVLSVAVAFLAAGMIRLANKMGYRA